MVQGRTTGEPLKDKMPRDPRAFLQQAEESRRKGRPKEAIAVCLEALSRHPALDAARVTLGRAYLESDQVDLALATLEEVFQRLPEHHLAGRLLAEAQSKSGRRESARATCRALLERYPHDREIESFLAAIDAEGPPAGEASASGAVRGAAASGGAPEAAAAVADPEPEYLPEDVGSRPAPESAAPQRAAPPPAAGTRSRAEGAPPPPAAPMPERREPAAAVAARPVAEAPLPAPRARPGTPPDPAPPSRAPEGDALQTNTLAELYVRQGLPERALEVYRGMLRVDPGNDRARARLAELETAAPRAAAGTTTAAPAVTARAAGSAGAGAGGTPVRPETAPAPPAGAGPQPSAALPGRARERAAIERLESWLDAIRTGSRTAAGGS